VLSDDIRGNNTSTICGPTYLPAVLAGGDPSKAIACYADGFKRTGGSHLLDVGIKHRLNGQTMLVLHAGYQKTHNFRDADIFDYKAGIVYTQWGLDFGAEISGAKVRNSELAVVYDNAGNTKRVDRTALILSVAKRF
jgi:hypothetical protein